jgi:hypothetical protein
MTQPLQSERAKPNRLPDQAGDACVPGCSEAPREEGKCPAPDRPGPSADGCCGAHPQIAASSLSTAHGRCIRGHSTPIAAVHLIGPPLVSSGEINQLQLRVRELAFAGNVTKRCRQLAVLPTLFPPDPIGFWPRPAPTMAASSGPRCCASAGWSPVGAIGKQAEDAALDTEPPRARFRRGEPGDMAVWQRHGPPPSRQAMCSVSAGYETPASRNAPQAIIGVSSA